MNTESESDAKVNPRSSPNMICSITAGLICAFLVLVFVIVFAFLTANIAVQIYDARHVIPNPVERGDDIGEGMVLIFWAITSMVISVPMSFPLAKFFFKLISKILRCK